VFALFLLLFLEAINAVLGFFLSLVGFFRQCLHHSRLVRHGCHSRFTLRSAASLDVFNGLINFCPTDGKPWECSLDWRCLRQSLVRGSSSKLRTHVALGTLTLENSGCLHRGTIFVSVFASFSFYVAKSTSLVRYVSCI
jgi:hypothetical protein